MSLKSFLYKLFERIGVINDSPMSGSVYRPFDDDRFRKKVSSQMEIMSWGIAVKEAGVDYNGTSYTAGIINSSRSTVSKKMLDPDYAAKVASWESKYGYPAGYTASIITKTEYEPRSATSSMSGYSPTTRKSRRTSSRDTSSTDVGGSSGGCGTGGCSD